MITSRPNQSIEYLIRTFNTFIQQAVHYLNYYTQPGSTLSKSLYDILLLWIHPQGVINLVKTITMQHSNDESFTQVVQSESLVPPKRWATYGKIQEVNEPECTPEKPEKRAPRQSHSRVKQFSEEVYYNQSEEEEDSVNIKKQEGFQSSYSQSFKELYYKRGPYKSYSLSEKVRAVNLFVDQKLTIAEISKRLGIPCKNIKRWATEGVTRKRGGGRKRTNPGLQQQIYNWLFQNHTKGEHITITEIQEYALSRASDRHFKASRGWAIKFIERHNLRQYFYIL